MDSVDGSPDPIHISGSFMKPFLITLLGIMTTSLIIALYHFILIKLRRVRRQEEETLNTTSLLVNNNGDIQTGVDKKVLKILPIFPYSIQKHKEQFHDDQEAECVVCIGELEEGDLVRLLPTCNHAFHVSCIDKWFQEHSSCPVCRSPINARTNYCVSDSIFDEEYNGNDEIRSTQNQQFQGGEINNDEDCDDNSSLSPYDVQVQRQRRRMLRHCVSLALPMERRSRKRGGVRELNRSLSLDNQPCSIVIDIGKQCPKDLGSSSTSSKWSIQKFDCKLCSVRQITPNHTGQV